MAKKKYYVVWKGQKTGVFTSWNVCKKQITNFQGAQYKAFIDQKQAEIAFTKSYDDYKGKDTKKVILSDKEKASYGTPNLESISVDAACSGNPGAMEYRGVLTKSKKEIFRLGPFKKGTNNIGEFLALVHGIALLKNKKMDTYPIYSDSRTAMSWVQKKQCRTNIVFDPSNNDVLALIKRAEKWLKENTYNNPILKWETKAWGEIPADFGRK
ncbi:ribonuclease H family protein [Tenacibaculum finnmarkense genomovar finnmarkense]|uniref:Ribonuclease H n=1 Tax=Tenacibaculum finnmarkense genomovar finnmarkense TaxID=1458503 RepID=A0AAP1WFD0_9FLAO|nr:ribonuclease H family protein [Tenacibaculum finnmarkense]MBE7652106.1 ribonuclease H [Tenacibaculum finnmarkense genomovar finnmarkense]MBE7659642.1 ribonuclease H [Tenacibaculum finnmarkense genomovar finnmarkense]MBE7691843.1 ribonuclease H [Tenacibaculum finnmarkense genomovar finnmarkense]MBE7694179.1 ribonuclease H [Tenacibaculum finnmarkense genomovar finnmarkense]MCD8401648.1 ribonuclease H family protein [Tenacibaculum finnmarkense genomovar finnmarkense]